jgi:hypothetical protein
MTKETDKTVEEIGEKKKKKKKNKNKLKNKK